MTAQINTIQNFGLRSFINILQSMVKNIKSNLSQSFFDSASLEIEKATDELWSFYYYIISAEREDLLKYNFDNVLETLENSSEKIEKILSTLNEIKSKEPYLQVFKSKLDNFYTALVQCKIELSFTDAELEYETNKAS